MAWSNSKVFAALMTDLMNNTTEVDAGADTLKVALYTNAITPDNTAASASTAYNAGQWADTNEVDDSTEWDAAGEPLTSVTSTFSSTTYTLDAANTPSGGSSATLADVYGGLVYSDTIVTPVADQGLCYNYFGGVNSVTNGTFTVVWSGSGIMTISVA